MSLLPFTNPLVERVPRLAILSLEKTTFLEIFLNLKSSNILSLNVTTHSSLIEWIEIPFCPLDVTLTLLKDVSGIIFVSNDLKYLDTVISRTFINNVLIFKSNSVFKIVVQSFPEIHLDFQNPDHVIQAKPVLDQFLESIITEYYK